MAGRPFYSDAQREAVIKAVLEDGLSARKAVEEARLGRLEVGPFDMPVSTAQGIVRHAKMFRTRENFSDRLAQAADRLLSVAERGVADAEKRNSENDGDHLEARRAAELLLRVQKLVNTMDLSADLKFRESETDEPPATETPDNDAARELIEAVRRSQAEKEQVAQQAPAGHSQPDPELRKRIGQIYANPSAGAESAADRKARERAEMARKLGIARELGIDDE
jgi:hypothetical protein